MWLSTADFVSEAVCQPLQAPAGLTSLRFCLRAAASKLLVHSTAVRVVPSLVFDIRQNKTGCCSVPELLCTTRDLSSSLTVRKPQPSEATVLFLYAGASLPSWALLGQASQPWWQRWLHACAQGAQLLARCALQHAFHCFSSVQSQKYGHMQWPQALS